MFHLIPNKSSLVVATCGLSLEAITIKPSDRFVYVEGFKAVPDDQRCPECAEAYGIQLLQGIKKNEY